MSWSVVCWGVTTIAVVLLIERVWRLHHRVDRMERGLRPVVELVAEARARRRCHLRCVDKPGMFSSRSLWLQHSLIMVALVMLAVGMLDPAREQNMERRSRPAVEPEQDEPTEMDRHVPAEEPIGASPGRSMRPQEPATEPTQTTETSPGEEAAMPTVAAPPTTDQPPSTTIPAAPAPTTTTTELDRQDESATVDEPTTTTTTTVPEPEPMADASCRSTHVLNLPVLAQCVG